MTFVRVSSQDEINAYEENIERFHRKSLEIQELLQSQEAPLELQVRTDAAAPHLTDTAQPSHVTFTTKHRPSSEPPRRTPPPPGDRYPAYEEGGAG